MCPVILSLPCPACFVILSLPLARLPKDLFFCHPEPTP